MKKPKESEIVWKAVRELSVFWPESQHPLNIKRAAHIADALDPDLLGVIIICRTPLAGMFHIIDGQHRVDAVRSALGNDQTVPCKLVDCDGPARAAELFVLYNTTHKAPTAISLHRARITQGDPIALGVDAVLRKRGLVIDSAMQDGCVRAVHVCTNVFKRHGGAILGKALDALIQVWGKDKNALDGYLIAGFSLFFARHGSRADVRRLCDRVSKSLTPGRLLGAGKTAAEVNGGGTAGGIVRALLKNYNDGLRVGRLGDSGASDPDAEAA